MDKDIFTTEFFEKLNTINLSINMRLNKGAGGGRKSNAKGTSVEFSDFREYNLGDDIRRIDWNAYGRFDKLYVKEFMEEKEGIFNIFLDTSKSMDFGDSLKSVMALQIAGALSYIILNNTDRVFVNEINDADILTSKGRNGKNAYKKVIDDLGKIKFDGKTNISDAVKKRNLTYRGCSIIISDFLDSKGIEEAVKYLAYKKQEIILIQVLAREEIEVDMEGTVNMIDIETNEDIKITLTKTVIEKYKEQLTALTLELERLSKKYHMIYIRAISDEPIDKVIFEGFKNTGFLY